MNTNTVRKSKVATIISNITDNEELQQKLKITVSAGRPLQGVAVLWDGGADLAVMPISSLESWENMAKAYISRGYFSLQFNSLRDIKNA